VNTLTPAFAQRIQPVPEGSASPEAAAIGQIEWRIDHLPAGKYDLLMQYAAPDLEADLPISIEFAGQKITQTLGKDRATKDAKSYRLYRIGQIQLTQDSSGEILRLTAGTSQSATLLLRNFVISQVRPAP
jgi:hypothetical protein